LKLHHLLALILLAAAGTRAIAHHSVAMFDSSKRQRLDGIIKEVQWVNPHAVLWIYVDAAAGRDPVVWSLEMSSPGNLAHFGIGRHALHPGDKVSVQFYPLRDGRHSGLLKQVTVAGSGQVFNIGELTDLDKPNLQ
jgi:hypothetical protein